MLKTLSRYWWLVVLRGAMAIVFGILAFAWPDITVNALVLLFGVYVFVDGISALISGITGRSENRRWWVLLLEGIAGIVAGIVAFVWTGITALLLLYVIAAWAVVTGIMEIAGAIALREEIDNEWVLALSGLASIIFGLAIFFFPGAGALALVWLIGAYAIFFGALMVYLGFKLRRAEGTAVLQST